MSEIATQIEAAWIGGHLDAAQQLAEGWLRETEQQGLHDPRPAFTLNVGHLMSGDMAMAWAYHGRALQDAADIETVTTWLAQIRERQGDNGWLHLVTGLCLSQSGQSEPSMAHFKQAIMLLPTLPQPHQFLAQVYERAARTDMAIREYKEAVRLDGTYTPARAALGMLYQAQGQLELALPQFREVVRLRPNDAMGHGMLASALATQGKFEPALKAYKEAVRLDPRNAELHFALGKYYQDRGRIQLALQEYREAVAIDQDFSPAHTELGWMMLEQSDPLNAMDAFNRALRSDENNARAYLGVAKLYAARGKREAAWQNYQKALKLERDPQVRNNIINQLFLEGGSWDV